MACNPDYQTVRTVPHTARLFLERLGYQAVQVSKSSIPIDIIAWKGRDELLFVHVISSRDRKNEEVYHSRICTLTGLVRAIPYQAEVELLTMQNSVWERYRVMPGGMYSLSGGGV